MAKPWEQYQAPKPWDQYKAVDQITEKKEPSFGEQAFGALETIGTIASAIPATIAGGVTGATTALLTGDPTAGEAVRRGVEESLTYEGGEASRRQLEAIGSGIKSVEESVIRPALAGTAGLVDIALQPSQLLTGVEQARGTVRSVREKGLGRSAGEQALELTGSPAVATAFDIAPTLMAEFGGGLSGRILGQGKLASARAKTTEAKTAIDDLMSGDVKTSTVENVAETIKKGDTEDISAMIDADPEFFRAMDELNISSEPLASYASKNPQYRDVEMALSSIPGSVLVPQAVNFIKETSRKADELIQQYGGTIDKAQLGLDFKADSLKNVDDLFQQADEAYSALRQVIPEASKFPAPNTVSFLEDLASKDKLPPKFARMLNQLKTKTKKGPVRVDPVTMIPRTTGETINPTLGRIDLIRKEIGQAINRGSGQFKDMETGLNKALYARLTRDQDAIAEGVGGEALAISDAGKSLVKQRKQIEDNLKTLLGKDLNQALNVNVSGAIKGLQKGEIDKFNRVMNSIPENKRGEVALSAMNDVFKGSGVNQQSLNPTQFVKWYNTINRSPSAKRALFGVLPKESKRAIDNLFKVSEGVSRALGQKVPTGRINAMFNEKTGFIRKMVGRVVPVAVAFATKSPVASAIASNVTEQFLKQSTDGAKRASDLMGSPQFQNIIRQATKDGVIEGGKVSRKLESLEKNLEKTQKYQKWVEGLPTQDAFMLGGGLLGYLFGDESVE